MYNYILAPILITLVSESIVAWILEFRHSRQLWVIAGINLITNPLLNIGLLLYANVNPPAITGIPVILFSETVIVLVEYGLLRTMFPEEARLKICLLSILANTASFGAGLILL